MVEPRVLPTFGPRLGHGIMAESPGMRGSSDSTLVQLTLWHALIEEDSGHMGSDYSRPAPCAFTRSTKSQTRASRGPSNSACDGGPSAYTEAR
jgi:hypothetical protein